MNTHDKQRLIELLEEALAILRDDAEASAQSESGGSGNGPPP